MTERLWGSFLVGWLPPSIFCAFTDCWRTSPDFSRSNHLGFSQCLHYFITPYDLAIFVKKWRRSTPFCWSRELIFWSEYISGKDRLVLAQSMSGVLDVRLFLFPEVFRQKMLWKIFKNSAKNSKKCRLNSKKCCRKPKKIHFWTLFVNFLLSK
jgi:hypothetical protein